LPTAVPNATNGLLTFGTGAGQISPDGSGNVALAANCITVTQVKQNALNNVTIDGVPLLQHIAIISAACAGQSTGVDVGTPVYDNINGSTPRISCNALNGNRSSVVLSLPSLPS